MAKFNVISAYEASAEGASKKRAKNAVGAVVAGGRR